MFGRTNPRHRIVRVVQRRPRRRIRPPSERPVPEPFNKFVVDCLLNFLLLVLIGFMMASLYCMYKRY